jgi:hypothetical protein
MDSKQTLIDELDAFDPQWRLRYATLYDAAQSCRCEDLYALYTSSLSGLNERGRISAPNYLGAAKAASESQSRLEDAGE